MNYEARHLIEKYKGVGKRLGIEEAAIIVNNFVTRIELNEYQYGAIVSFVDNRGAQAFYQSRLLRIINDEANDEWVVDAAKEFTKPCWSRYNGKQYKSMEIRRVKEKMLFLRPLLVVHNAEAKR